jgi:hypothetical protein
MALCILKKCFLLYALLCPEPYLGSALADFLETWYEYISPARGGGILFGVVRLSVRLPVCPSLLCPEPYLGSAFADFIETWYEYIY